MRTHTALHVLCGVIWADFGVAVTGGNMEPGTGRLDFELDAMSAELGAQVERRINEEIARAREIVVDFVGPRRGRRDPALIRTKANLIPASITRCGSSTSSGSTSRPTAAPTSRAPRGRPGRGDEDRVEGQGEQAHPHRRP
jgi:misacylated tRNA(Ala) deacylase